MITAENICFAYVRGKPVLENISFSLPAGSVCGLLGRNGAGKTTLLKLLCGLAFPVTGHCFLDGSDVRDRAVSTLQGLFYLPEEFVLPDITVKRYMSVYAPLYDKFDRELFKTLIEGFELSMGDNLSAMSYGMRKKVLLAFAMAIRARMLLMDEPTHGLDIPSKKQFRKMLVTAVTEKQNIIMATQQVRDIGTMLDHIMILHNNRLILNEQVDTITSVLDFSEKSDSSVIYSESSISGLRVLSANTSGVNSDFDAELLFNGIMHNPATVTELFTGTKTVKI